MADPIPSERQRARAILETLAHRSPATTAELATALETHPVTVERTCRALQEDGRIRQCAGGVYTLAKTDAASDEEWYAARDPGGAIGDRNATSNPAD
ncbi:HTH domain-containing protein [Natronorubrum sp. JWXQ-INN-674]|uniref:HTH domain-containing protein n=1 Tax=Natronorubrum halalkaliphilum TaxID=2691917 RepID=A0A6B0VGP1_9EURY|nr:HTH domain-containing protein [Natronorubrum halalkaliphilum]MXV60690.1 HTH domain-containing protein [Natronorubrum halalkaliphilum]